MFARSSGLNRIVRRAYSQVRTSGSGGGGAKSSGGGAAAAPSTTANVTGLSSNCVRPISGPVGPGAAPNADYKVPEYFSFNRFSFAEAEVEMAKYRCPQPSALKK